MQSPSYNQGNQPLSFEEALSRLEEIVHSLETGQLSLDETVALYEEGQRLRAFCEQKLTEAQLRIRVVTETSVIDVDVDELRATQQLPSVGSFQSTNDKNDCDINIQLDDYDTDYDDDPFR